MHIFDGYLTWWMGGIALGTFTIVFRLLTSRTLGVSGSWKKIIFWRQEREQDKTAQAMASNQGNVASALLAETLAEFGSDAALSQAPTKTSSDKAQPASQQNIPWTAHLVFLLAMALGGLLWALYTGNFSINFELSPIHNQWTGDGLTAGFILLIGGFMVGFGTQMAGGCSSGHGLSGCSNFSVTSFAATFTFFITAVVVALIIKVAIL
jgi:uncharacterized membrane protein YedE/YeeE